MHWNHPGIRSGIAAAALLLAPAFSQQDGSDSRPARRLGMLERTEIRVLLVDLIVADRKGNLVTDLTRDEVHLFIDDREIEFDSFDALTRVRLAAPPAAEGGVVPPPARPDRGLHRAILFYDSLNSRMLDQQRVREQILKYFERNLLPFDEVMILSHGDRLRVVQPFTADPETWRASLRRN